MRYHELNLKTQPSPHRVGRGIAAGQGKTAGRGTKGQKSRAGSSRRPGFEGGQNPLTQRFPKLRGFTSHRTKFDIVYTAQINNLASAKITNDTLAAAGLVPNAHTQVKLILKGQLTKKVSVNLQKASTAAVKAIEKAGGVFMVTPQVPRPAKANDHTPKTK
jgi:large subunit ribosomal protein L15